MRSSDLAPLFTTPAAGKQVGYRQGVIVTWNPNTAENTVLVGDSLLQNMPILNTSEAAILAQGDIVAILTSGATWGILGRFTIPGSPEAVSSLSSLRTQSDDVPASDSSTSATLTDLATFGPQVTINIGPSGKALVILSAELVFEAPALSGISTGGAYMAYELTGANTSPAAELRGMHCNVRYNSSQSGGFDTAIGITTGCSRVMMRTGLTPGMTTFTTKYRRDGTGTCTFTNRNLTVMAL